MKKSRCFSTFWLLLLLSRVALPEPFAAEPGDQPFHFKARTRTTHGVLEKDLTWTAQNTAIVVCDMWDQHWCKGATRRVAEMAPRMNEVLKEARRRGAFIIHAPSSTMGFYTNTIARQRALSSQPVPPKVPLQGWCRLDPAREGPLPIDDSDGGCDDWPQCQGGAPWKRQIPTLEIQDEDAITDSAEAYYLMQQRGIENVIVLGVHVNMCVLGRPFSIRQMVYQGKNVVLMRDLTDSMYNSRRAPYVRHSRGTELVVEHIEQYWCPTVTSADLLGGEPFRFSETDTPNSAPEKTPDAPGSVPALDKAGQKGAAAGPKSPGEALPMFTVASDLVLEQVLAEPEVRQPVFLAFDERARLWVVQYLQYPEPAGLKPVSRDQFWRAVYDKVPPPPPHHVRGRDKITIHEDTDQDGVFDKHKVFVEGLNIATAVTWGRGGVWILNPPYLLFYPDADLDDVPDADPVVHLAGFGLEDTHSVVNSLRWGPDGWLYAAQGSTVTAKVTRPGLQAPPVSSMGQLIWRYHPETRQYEVFAEGGGNAFGVEIDAEGRVYSGHNGGNTRGFYYVQGAYLQKGFTKHGPLSNPYAFGFFPPMQHPPAERFTHNFVIYDGGALPERYQRSLLGIEPLQGRIVTARISPDGSTFKTEDSHYALASSDPWFRPVDIKVGPDGALYIADWYDQQVNHYRNHEGQIDRSNGRIYRLRAKNSPRQRAVTLTGQSSTQLVGLLSHANIWVRQTALRLLADHPDPSIAPACLELLRHQTGQTALEALWALHLAGALTQADSIALLQHPNPHVRRWVVRLIAEDDVTLETGAALLDLAGREQDIEVRCQLAASSRRLQQLPLVLGLVRILAGARSTADQDDPQIPLFLWWAIEAKVSSHNAEILNFFRDHTVWEAPTVSQTILPRLVQRYAAAASPDDFTACATLLQLAPRAELRDRLVRAFEQTYKGRPISALPPDLVRELTRGQTSLTFALLQGDAGAVDRARAHWQDPKADLNERIQLLQLLAGMKDSETRSALLNLLRQPEPSPLLQGALAALASYEEDGVGKAVLAKFNELPAAAKLAAEDLLSRRATSSLLLLEAIRTARVSKTAFSSELARRLLESKDPAIAQTAQSVWPELNAPADAAEERQIRSLTTLLQASSGGDPYRGKKLFTTACGACHTLFAEGGHAGPDLTPYQRSDLPNLLLNIVRPSVEIREGFESFSATLKDEETVIGFILRQDDRTVVMRGLDGQETVLPRHEISELRPAGRSLMPEGLLESLNEEELRDLFAYLRSSQPLNN